MKAFRRQFGFTLIEMLVVIAILGIIAGLAVPSIKNLGKSNINVSASRQLLDDVGRARQLAMANRTTVYMVFIPTNFWNLAYGTGPINNTWLNSLNSAAQNTATNFCDSQLTGYFFAGLGAVGDQPGRHNWRYLGSQQNLPEGVFLAQQKFTTPPNLYYVISDPVSGAAYNVYGFNFTNTIPFPTETNTYPVSASSPLPFLPYLAFNYLGQLTSDGVNVALHDEYIPLAHGTVAPAVDPATKAYKFAGLPTVTENPSGNSTNISYNIIHIDALTGRAVLEFHKMLP